MYQYRPASQPDERQEAILFSQAFNLSAQMVSAWAIGKGKEELRKDIEEWHSYFFEQLMLPYAPLKKAQKEREELLNKKVRTKELHTDPDTDFGEGQD